MTACNLDLHNLDNTLVTMVTLGICSQQHNHMGESSMIILTPTHEEFSDPNCDITGAIHKRQILADMPNCYCIPFHIQFPNEFFVIFQQYAQF